MTIRWRAELAAFVTLLVIYVATLAPGVTLWDSGEFLAAIHSLGIPHPPGTPLYILVANVWAHLLSPLIGFAYSINLLSALCTAIACAICANLFVRWTGDSLAAYAAAVCAGAMSSVWLSATETEVYSSALLVACLILWIAQRQHESDQKKWLLLGAYVGGLGFALHLTALLTVPPAIWLVTYGGRWRTIARSFPSMLVMFALGASAVLFMIVRAKHDPWINQGNPSTIAALSDVLLRRQYAPAPLWPRQAPLFIQFGNLFEYADWQVALGLNADPPPSVLRTGITILFGFLGVAGFISHRRADRRSWSALVVLFATATLGVLAYLNLKAGPSYGGSFIPAGAKHEARERDYFFALAFLCWGLWAGFGAVRLARHAARNLRPRANAALKAAGVLVACIPILLNWNAVTRRTEPRASEARRQGTEILANQPPKAIVLTHADNDTYPAWYLQTVEGLRRDVTIVVVPLLPAAWYRSELARRQGLLSADLVERWQGTGPIVAALCRRASHESRPVVDATLNTANRFETTCNAR